MESNEEPPQDNEGNRSGIANHTTLEQEQGELVLANLPSAHSTLQLPNYLGRPSLLSFQETSQGNTLPLITNSNANVRAFDLLSSVSIPTSNIYSSSPLLQAHAVSSTNLLALTTPYLQQQLTSMNAASLGNFSDTLRQEEELARLLFLATNSGSIPSVTTGQPIGPRVVDIASSNAGLGSSTSTTQAAALLTSRSSDHVDTSVISSTTLYMEGDEDCLTTYQCLLRKQLEIFEAGPKDVRSTAQGRSCPIVLGQVGIRCRYCADLPIGARAKGAAYYSQTIDVIYQIAQNISNIHLCEKCYRVPQDLRCKLLLLRSEGRRAAGGKKYWSDRLRSMGVYEDGRILRLNKKKSKEEKKP